jgi:molybdopterin molybdotransferase
MENKLVMISFEQAIALVESSVKSLPEEQVPFMRTVNRILSREVLSDTDMPPFNKAAMDGFACRKADLGHELEIIEEISAGRMPLKKIGPGECTRIMTGSMVPEGADCILMKEHAEISASGKIRCSIESDADNICYQGEDVKRGDSILKPGTRLLPVHLAMLASVGCINPFVYKMPAVAVLSTGNELVRPDQKPGAAQIRDSNGYQLVAQVSQMGLHGDYLGIVKDSKSALNEVLTAALERYELVLISGGVSVGDYDYVPEVLDRLKVETLIHGMQVKPGKRLLFGKREGHYVVGLPGNPVSSLIQFEVLVKLILNRLMGCTDKAVRFLLPLEKRYTRKKMETLSFVPVDITENSTVMPLEYHGSAHIKAYTGARGIMEVPLGVSELKKGAGVYVRPF